MSGDDRRGLSTLPRRCPTSNKARRAGLDARRYGHYVRDLHEPDLGTLVRIADVLGVTPDTLLLPDPRIPEGGRASPERSGLTSRLLAAADALDEGDLDLVVHQVEAAVRQRREQRRPPARDG